MKKASLPEITHAEVIRRLQLEIEQAGSENKAARVFGISRDLLNKTMRGERTIGPMLLKALKLRRITLVVHRYEAANRGPWTQTVRKLPRGTERREAE